MPEPFSESIHIAGVVTPARDLIAIAASVFLLLLLTLLLKRTTLGIALRAATTLPVHEVSPDAARPRTARKESSPSREGTES